MEKTLVQIRERSLIDLFDLSLVVIRRRPWPIGLSALAGVVPFYLLNLLLFSVSEQETEGWALLLWLIEAPFAFAPLTVVLGQMMFGQDVTFRIVAGRVISRFFALIITHGFLRYVLFFFIPTRLAFANAILLLERGKLTRLLSRGGDLVNARQGELFLVLMGQMLLTYAAVPLFNLGYSRLRQIFMAESMTFDLDITSQLSSWLVQVPIWGCAFFFTVVRFLIYIDQRIRLEGWEVRLRILDVARSMKENERW